MELVNFISDTILNIKNEYSLTNNDYNNVLNHVAELVSTIYDKNIDYVQYIFDQMVDTNLQYVESEVVLPKDKSTNTVPEEYTKLVDHIKYIANIPQPEQRTQKWFDMRKKMLTASTCAQALDQNPYANQSANHLVLDKVGFSKRFVENIYVHHGKKYEEVATMIFEHLYDSQIDEYGLIPDISPNKSGFLGASPDGISTQYKLTDRSFSDRVGRMLEIKCPYSRKIKLKGKIDGGICPHYYWCQVQQQLKCCALEKCDFWQCSLIEYETEEQLLNDDTEPLIYQEQEQPMTFNKNITMGAIIQLRYKKDVSNNDYQCKYIYPPHLNFTLNQYKRWIIRELENLEPGDLIFDKVLYWKLKLGHNVCINFDHKWFESIMPKLNETWNKVLYYRDHFDEAKDLQKKINPVKKYDDAFISSDTEDSEDSEDVKDVKDKKDKKDKKDLKKNIKKTKTKKTKTTKTKKTRLAN